VDPTHDLARAPTLSRLEPQSDRQALSRLPRALVAPCIASYSAPPAAIGLALDHAEDPTSGQQEFAFYTHHYQNHGSLPLFSFEGPSPALGMACLRPGNHPTGTENAMILVRLLSSLRRHWPHTPLRGRGASHCATPEVLDVSTS
jgi:Transposase DDE domain group 1